jgi:16S rRNA U1498 N3-methylase RsmE
VFLEDELDILFPLQTHLRLIAHPTKLASPEQPQAETITSLKASKKRVVIAIGPEGGWDEPFELQFFG